MHVARPEAICREFHLSRKVVRKVIRSEATAFRYERERQPLPRIDPWREQLDALLLADEARPARERLTLVRLFEELRGFGYEGSYDAVRRYARGNPAGERRYLLHPLGTPLAPIRSAASY